MAARRSERAAAPAAPKGRETRATSRMAEGGDEAAAPKAGMGLGDAMGIVSFLLLLAAIVLTDMMLGQQ